MRSLWLTAARKCDAVAGQGIRIAHADEGTHRAVTTDDGGLDFLSVAHDRYERHQSVQREIDLDDRSLLLLQDRAPREAGCAEMRTDKRVIGRVECRQQPVFALVKHRRLNRPSVPSDAKHSLSIDRDFSRLAEPGP
jgi:hypothetical protein